MQSGLAPPPLPGAAGPSALPQCLQLHPDYTTQLPPAAGPSADPRRQPRRRRDGGGGADGGGVPGLDFLSASVPPVNKTYCWGGILEGVICPHHVDKDQSGKKRACYYCAAHQKEVQVPLARVRIAEGREAKPASWTGKGSGLVKAKGFLTPYKRIAPPSPAHGGGGSSVGVGGDGGGGGNLIGMLLNAGDQAKEGLIRAKPPKFLLSPVAPNGFVTLPDGSVQYVNGVVKKPDGSFDGAVEREDGTGELPDGTVTKSGGTKIYPSGVVETPDGTFEFVDGVSGELQHDGSIKMPSGEVILPDGSIQKPDGTIVYKDGSFKLPSGVIRNAARSSSPLEASTWATWPTCAPRLGSKVGV